MGEGDPEKADQYFSLFIYVSIVIGVIIMAVLPALILQYAFQSFFITAEKPQLGLFVSLAAGVTNIIGDALFVALFRWGLAGAGARVPAPAL